MSLFSRSSFHLLSNCSPILGSNGAVAFVGLYYVVVTTALRPSSSSSSSSPPQQTSKKSTIFKKLTSRVRTKRGYQNEIDGNINDDDSSDLLVVLSGEEEQQQQQYGLFDDNNLGSRKSFGLRLQTILDENNRDARLNRYSYLPTKRSKRKQPQKKVPIETVEELRMAVLDHQLSLSDTEIAVEQDLQLSDVAIDDTDAITFTDYRSSDESPYFVSDAAAAAAKRYMSGSTPGNRLSTDNSTLALAIEGGGMRGCVSAGMVAAITALGLSDTVDTIYGSSAGSVVGAYMVSRQVCLDVYVDILPASKKLFVCKNRMIKNLASSLGRILIDRRKTRTNNKNSLSPSASSSPSSTPFSSLPISTRQSLTLSERLAKTPPGMNISFVLDGIMGNDHGIRPLDIESFQRNDQKQKLRVVSSCVDPSTGKLYSTCFGTDDFFHNEDMMVEHTNTGSSVHNEDTKLRREGIFACLQASMTVPGATGPPVNLIRKKNFSSNGNDSSTPDTHLPISCFDAFCFEPIPYRSAVHEGATHVLVLTTRPGDYVPKTKPGVYETSIAPIYFHSHGHRNVAEFFKNGGQQYLYAEDLMLLDEARQLKVSSSSSSSLDEQQQEGVLVPPPIILYGVPKTKEIVDTIENREKEWNRAHLFSLTVPEGHKELDPLEQDKDEVLEAIRGGFETAFDSLSDIVGLEGYKGRDVAELVFPNREPASASSSSSFSLEEEILGTKLHIPGEPIPDYNNNNGRAGINTNTTTMITTDSISFLDGTRMIGRRGGGGGGLFGSGSHMPDVDNDGISHLQKQQEFSKTLFECLPGFQDGRYGHLAKGLREGSNNNNIVGATSANKNNTI
ncbi:hypothetical protein FRACYDRAFT_241052 [Fragilariopsis cylindrus CCMP1102]|uniref:PNPLA domain-containing protein n=1 Tax=Fragilariopsis cylindrus CCMP1102 TaxID=635003 RepID=A0A1E7F911_9STRA|nr:hypothetical protein FRACYDRAFT_241052 [Fragilariopsis cylindrus CCMP1102]|eukprot:OEU14505.1 hypothetical protein FRACYDRAFT_241052 [Fragilariopsis cylindrus CCMP1102]